VHSFKLYYPILKKLRKGAVKKQDQSKSIVKKKALIFRAFFFTIY